MMRKLCRLGVLGSVAVLAAGCAIEAPSSRTTPSLLEANGTGAAIISREWWVLLTVGGLIFLLVVALMLAAVLRQRRRLHREQVDVSEAAPAAHAGGGTRWIWLGGRGTSGWRSRGRGFEWLA